MAAHQTFAGARSEVLRNNWPLIPDGFIEHFVDQHWETPLIGGYTVERVCLQIMAFDGPPAHNLIHMMRTPAYNLTTSLFATLQDGLNYISDFLENQFAELGEDANNYKRIWLQTFVRTMYTVPFPYQMLMANPDMLDWIMPTRLAAPRTLGPLAAEDAASDMESDDEPPAPPALRWGLPRQGNHANIARELFGGAEDFDLAQDLTVPEPRLWDGYDSEATEPYDIATSDEEATQDWDPEATQPWNARSP